MIGAVNKEKDHGGIWNDMPKSSITLSTSNRKI